MKGTGHFLLTLLFYAILDLAWGLFAGALLSWASWKVGRYLNW